MRSERDVKARIKEILTELEAFWYMPVQTGYGVVGIPDFVGCLNGKFFGIEAKFGGNTESAWQKKQGARIKAARGTYLVIDENSVDTLKAQLLALQ